MEDNILESPQRSNTFSSRWQDQGRFMSDAERDQSQGAAAWD